MQMMSPVHDGVNLDSFTPRQISMKGWAGLGTPEAVRKAADLLADYDWLRRDVVQSGDALGRGRPSDRYTINPAALHETVGRLKNQIFPDTHPTETTKRVSAVSVGTRVGHI